MGVKYSAELMDRKMLVDIVRIAADCLQDFAAAIERMPQPAPPEPTHKQMFEYARRVTTVPVIDDEDAGSYVHYEAEREELAQRFREASGHRIIKLTDVLPFRLRDADGDEWQLGPDGKYSLFNEAGVREIGPWSRSVVENTYGVAPT